MKNQILSQMMTRIAKVILSLLISMNSQLSLRMPVLTFVPDDQIAEVTVQAHTI